MRRAIVWTAMAAASLGGPVPARALQYQLSSLEAGKYLIEARGPIVAGDADRLKNFILANITKGAIVGFAFDSPGGSILEGETLAGVVHTTGAVVFVLENSTCASACFLESISNRLINGISH